MQIEEIMSVLLGGLVIDLSKKVMPGRAQGPLDSGKRTYEISPFLFPPGEIMHNIQMESHISTHIEAPSHFIPARCGTPAEDISDVELTKFFGMETLVDCSSLSQNSAVGGDLLSRFDVRENDIVLIGKCQYQGERRSHRNKGRRRIYHQERRENGWF